METKNFQPADFLEEKDKPYLLFSERHLQALWFEQKYFSPLRTLRGESVEVLSPGLWNLTSGPDFSRAHLRIGDREVQGDVEIHLVQDGWWQHGHHHDPQYNNVVLHLYLHKNKREAEVRTAQGVSLEQVCLESFLTIPLARITQYIDLDLYPYKKYVGSGQCAKQLYAHWSERKVEELFLAAAWERLQIKAEAFRCLYPESEQWIEAALARLLGSPRNGRVFEAIYVAFSEQADVSEDSLIALGMGLCSFFDEPFARKWRSSAQYHHYRRLWKQYEGEVVPSFSVNLQNTRPLSHPIRRIVALAKLLRSESLRSVPSILKGIWRSYRQEGKQYDLQQALVSLLPLLRDHYWNAHYNFEEEPRKERLPLLGPAFRQEAIWNVWLPWLSVALPVEEKERILDFYQRLRSTPSGKGRYLQHRFFGDTPKGQLLEKAFVQQGAYQIHRDYCRHFEASCQGCPFVKESNKYFISKVGCLVSN